MKRSATTTIASLALTTISCATEPAEQRQVSEHWAVTRVEAAQNNYAFHRSLCDLTKNSAFVGRFRVTSISSFMGADPYFDGPETIVSTLTLPLVEAWAGNPPDELKVRMRGGEDRNGRIFPGDADYEVGEEVLLFVPSKTANDVAQPVDGYYHGLGEEMVFRAGTDGGWHTEFLLNETGPYTGATLQPMVAKIFEEPGCSTDIRPDEEIRASSTSEAADEEAPHEVEPTQP